MISILMASASSYLRFLTIRHVLYLYIDILDIAFRFKSQHFVKTLSD